MALQNNITTDSNLEVSNAYIRVENIKVQSKQSICFKLKAYKNADEQLSFYENILGCPFDLEGGNPFQQAYEHLKTLPEFSGATDC
jgi:hypothetical protein